MFEIIYRIINRRNGLTEDVVHQLTSTP